ncbi:MAG: glycosyltransferase [Candidatus Omnitrophica bacterium]|nr:glycosyltransferase [Candidatus Omnitrophota bacterium]
MITVLHLSHCLNRYDYIDAVIRHADPAQFRMLAATLTDDGSVRPGAAPYPVTVLGVRARTQWPAAAAALRRLCRSERVDVVHTHNLDSTAIGAFAALGIRRVRLVIGRHYADALYQLRPAWKCRALLALEGWCNRRAARLIAPSSMVRAILVERQRVPARRVAQIPYGFDFAKHQASVDAPARLRRELGLEGAAVLGSFSRLNADKGHADLLRAFARLQPGRPTLRLLLVGEGNVRPRLEALARELGVQERVRFAGWRADVIDLMAMADVVAHPSLHEAFSQVMVEALAMGKPLVITDVSGVADVVRDGWNGLIVPKADPAALAAAVTRLLDHPEEAAAMGARGRARVRRELDIHVIITQYEAVYRNVMGQEQSPNTKSQSPNNHQDPITNDQTIEVIA